MFPGDETPRSLGVDFVAGLPRCQAIQRPKAASVGPRVIEPALHFPTPDIELAAGPTIETSPVGLTLVRKRPAHFLVPTTQEPGYQVADPAPRRNVL